MKVSELITRLQSLMEAHGDVTVMDGGDDWGYREVVDANFCEPWGRFKEPYIMIED